MSNGLWSTAVALTIWVGGAQANCWSEAGDAYSIEPELLYAIAEVESGFNSAAVNYNSNGSKDVGLMQINSFHLPRLQARGITEQRLRDEPCLAISVGASILSEFIAQYGYNWTAVGAYNAGNASDRQALRLRYASKVWKRYRALLLSGGI